MGEVKLGRERERETWWVLDQVLSLCTGGGGGSSTDLQNGG